MAQFLILKSEQIEKDINKSRFKINLENGILKEGDTFRLYDTHHPVDFKILLVENNYLYTSKSIPWEDWNKGAIVDTEKPKSALKYRDEN